MGTEEKAQALPPSLPVLGGEATEEQDVEEVEFLDEENCVFRVQNKGQYPRVQVTNDVTSMNMCKEACGWRAMQVNMTVPFLCQSNSQGSAIENYCYMTTKNTGNGCTKTLSPNID